MFTQRRSNLESILQSRGHLLFFAALPEPHVQAQVKQVVDHVHRAYRLTGPALRREHLHVTLQIAGLDVGAVRIAATRAAEAVQAAAFPVSLSELMSFRGRQYHPLVLVDEESAQGVRDLQGALRHEMGKVGFGCGRLESEPHMTLGYHPQMIKGGVVGPISWMVREFVLIQSHQGEGRHEIVGRWPLRGSVAPALQACA